MNGRGARWGAASLMPTHGGPQARPRQRSAPAQGAALGTRTNLADATAKSAAAGKLAAGIFARNVLSIVHEIEAVSRRYVRLLRRRTRAASAPHEAAVGTPAHYGAHSLASGPLSIIAKASTV